MSDAESLRANDVVHGFWSMTGDPAVIDTAAVRRARLHLRRHPARSRPGPSRFVHFHADGVLRRRRVGAGGESRPGADRPGPRPRSGRDRRSPRGVGRRCQRRPSTPPDTPPGRALVRDADAASWPFRRAALRGDQVETSAAVADIDAIAAVDGVDALYIGPADLGLGLGGAPAPDVLDVFDGTHPDASVLRTAFAAVVAAGHTHDVIAGAPLWQRGERRPGRDRRIHYDLGGSRPRADGDRSRRAAERARAASSGFGCDLRSSRLRKSAALISTLPTMIIPSQ